MGVAAGVDWERVARLAAGGGSSSNDGASCRVIPGFGIHPWWSHLHASAAGAAWPDLLEGRSADDVAEAVGILERARESQSATNKADTDAQAASSSSSNKSDSGPAAGAATLNKTTLDIVPHAEWRERLRALLAAHPRAIVGEVGIDRSAVIPGSRARVRPAHQWALFEEQVALAAELQRPVSVHCVRAYGHMRDFFAALPPDACPPAVMLHSYGGSPEEVGRFSGLPAIGGRFYFSFSAAINAGARSGPGDKLAARIRAVPRDRLLLESDQVTPTLVDEGMAHICALVATVRGWSKEETAQIARANFDRFFQYSMTEMESVG
jgi:TatD DNase family protein